MATTEKIHEKSSEQQAAELAEFRRQKCLEYEHNALDYGDHDTSMRHKLAQILCCGRTVRQGEAGDMTAERALMGFAAATTKAVGIALAHRPMVEDEHDVELYDHEASMALIGLSELLSAAPRLIDNFSCAGMELRSNGESQHQDSGEGEAGEDEEMQP